MLTIWKSVNIKWNKIMKNFGLETLVQKKYCSNVAHFNRLPCTKAQHPGKRTGWAVEKAFYFNTSRPNKVYNFIQLKYFLSKLFFLYCILKDAPNNRKKNSNITYWVRFLFFVINFYTRRKIKFCILGFAQCKFCFLCASKTIHGSLKVTYDKIYDFSHVYPIRYRLRNSIYTVGNNQKKSNNH